MKQLFLVLVIIYSQMLLAQEEIMDTTQQQVQKEEYVLPAHIMQLSLSYHHGAHVGYERALTGWGSDGFFYARRLPWLSSRLYVFASSWLWTRTDVAPTFVGSTGGGFAANIGGTALYYLGAGGAYTNAVYPRVYTGIKVIMTDLLADIHWEKGPSISDDEAVLGNNDYIRVRVALSPETFAGSSLPDWASALWLMGGFRSDFGLTYGLRYDVAALFSKQKKHRVFLSVSGVESQYGKGVLLSVVHEYMN